MKMKEELKKVRDQLIVQRYARSTMAAYDYALRCFLQWMGEREYSKDLAREYLIEKDFNHSKQNLVVNAIKFWRERIYGEPRIVFQDLRPKRGTYIPVVLSLDEVGRLIMVNSNLKHKAILSTIYFGALRNGEACKLKVADIDSDRMQIFVKGAKGKKDRLVDLDESLLAVLREYVRIYRPKSWLFEGQYGKEYAQTSVRQILIRSLKASAIRKNINVHSLRHSRATHWLENGNDAVFIQRQLGHAGLKTTLDYLKNARLPMKNPLLKVA